MKKPIIADLSFEERKAVLDTVEKEMQSPKEKEVVIGALDFCHSLIEDLKTSKININKLKALLGFHSERLKKLNQPH